MITNEQIDDMQRQLAEWQARNFGDVDDRDLALGIVEELGELIDSIKEDDHFDAIGDVLIYCGQLLARHEIPVSRVMPTHESEADAEGMLSYAGGVCHLVLKRHQKIRGLDDHDKFCREIVTTIRLMISAMGIRSKASVAYMSIGAKVLQRDWKANPVTAEANGGVS